MLPDFQLINNATKKMENIIINFEATQKEIREKIISTIKYVSDKYKIYDSKSNRELNFLRLLDNIIYTNVNFLKTFINIFELEEIVLFTTLSRGIFELHLILLEASDNEKNFYKIFLKISDSLKLFIQKFFDLAIKNMDNEAIKIFRDELNRIEQTIIKFSKRWGVNFKTIERYSKLFNFKKIAKKHGLLEDYNLEYSILSSFLHPTDLYIMTTPPIPNTMGQEKYKLAQWNVKNRKIFIKNICIIFSIDYSKKTLEKIKKLIKQY